MHGYQINELIEVHLGTSIELKKPTVYKLLGNMLENGWISYREEGVSTRSRFKGRRRFSESSVRIWPTTVQLRTSITSVSFILRPCPLRNLYRCFATGAMMSRVSEGKSILMKNTKVAINGCSHTNLSI
jgi:hypothetical protein